jgi:periplasmic divalent cation tolerance protein
MAQTGLMLAYITAANRDEAVKLATVLVQERLAACANIFPGMTSLYWWQGEVKTSEEVALLVKTRADLMDALTTRVRALHSYSVPCVVAWPIVEGNSDFLDWIAAETRAP